MNGASGMTDLDYASALCRAMNDYSIEHWLGADSRFRLCLHVCSQDPEGAAAEIDRIGDHPGVVAVIVPCGAPRPFGQRFYRPIHEACARHNLTFAMHFGGEGGGINPAPTAAGYPSYYIESRLARPSFYQVHLASFIFEGVFQRYPNLRVAMLEGSFGWVPTYMWRMDSDWKGLRYQTPWIDRLPSEIMTDHVRFASQPIDEPDTKEDLLTVVRWMHGERTLMFATDYPHWDWDDPAQSFTTFPAELRQRIFVENALDAFPKLASSLPIGGV
jgi:predicted TIM-barrel fold metal-dependent hydrolase